MFKKLKAYVISGPTNDELPSFSWEKSQLSDPHIGMVDTYNFKFEVFKFKEDGESDEEEAKGFLSEY